MLLDRIVLLTILLVLPACVTLPPPNPSNPIRTLAVLPFIDRSDKPAAANYIREVIAEDLENLHYAVQPIDETDQLLRERLNIADGRISQVAAQQLGEALQVDGLVYGIVDEFVPYEMVPLLYKEKRARARLSFIKASDGTRVWGNGAGVIRLQALGISLGGVEAAGQFKRQLMTNLQGNVRRTRTLPAGLDDIEAPWFLMTVSNPALDQFGEKKGFAEAVLTPLLVPFISTAVEATAGKALDHTNAGYSQIVTPLRRLIIFPDLRTTVGRKVKSDSELLQNMTPFPSGPLEKE